jgi:hypothetical protein
MRFDGRVAGMCRRVAGRVLLVGALAAGGASGASAEDDRSFLAFGAGWFDFNDDVQSVEFHAEIRTDYTLLWVLNPIAGLIVNTDRAVYGYVGVQADIFLGQRFVLTPSFAVGYYEEGDSKDLGHEIEFRSAVELAYRFDNRSRLGVQVYHLSNAGIGDSNPGTEVVALTYARPFGGP